MSPTTSIPQEHALASSPPSPLLPNVRSVTLTIGGNDIGFVPVVEACLNQKLDCHKAREGGVNARINALAGQGKATVPVTARVFLLAYPSPLAAEQAHPVNGQIRASPVGNLPSGSSIEPRREPGACRVAGAVASRITRRSQQPMTTGFKCAHNADHALDRRWLMRVADGSQNIPFGVVPAVLVPVAPTAQMGQSGTAEAAEASVSREMASRRSGRGRRRDLPEGVVIGEHVAVPSPPRASKHAQAGEDPDGGLFSMVIDPDTVLRARRQPAGAAVRAGVTAGRGQPFRIVPGGRSPWRGSG